MNIKLNIMFAVHADFENCEEAIINCAFRSNWACSYNTDDSYSFSFLWVQLCGDKLDSSKVSTRKVPTKLHVRYEASMCT